MRIVLDTNVFVSGIFFGGPPGTILEAWQNGQLEVAISVDILDEYDRVCNELSTAYPGIDCAPFLAAIALNATLFDCPPLQTPACADPDDDKFLACAVASVSACIVTGDKLLLKMAGYEQIEVLRPREFVDRYLPAK